MKLVFVLILLITFSSILSLTLLAVASEVRSGYWKLISSSSLNSITVDYKNIYTINIMIIHET